MVDAVAEILVENLNLLIRGEWSLFRGVEKDMEKLSNTLSAVRDVLADAETKQLMDMPIRNWLGRLKSAVYNASDALELWAMEAEQLELEHANTHQVSCSVFSFMCCDNFKYRRDMGIKFKEIISKFDEIAAQRSNFILTSGVVQAGSQFDQNRETSSIPTEPQIYGRDVDKNKLVHMLLGNVSREEDVSTCSIVGIGGLGKTALAQLVYNDDLIVDFFKVRIWVCVSDPFELKKVLKAIIESFNMEGCDLENLESMQKKVAEKLRGKKYLLVLDDVWTENREEWNQLKSFVKGGAKGSSIIVTSRSPTVASVARSVSTYTLGVLSDEACWSLFKSRAFDDDGNGEHLNLEAIGKQIIQKCRGLPLAAKSMGSLLWLETDENQWKRVRDGEIWELEEDEENTILPALRLSYNHLSPRLKECFAYCSIFPKDIRMKKDEVIRLWIANDFIQSTGGRELEDTGGELFKELVRRSFFQETEEDGCRNIDSFKIHDLMHNLACSVRVNENAIKEVGETKDIPNEIRHLSLICESPPPSNIVDPLLKSHPSLRTLLFFQSYTVTCRSLFNFSYLRICLRVLDLSKMDIECLPPSVSDLKFLSYLNLSSTSITSLPESIDGLRNLGMLDLSTNEGVTALPLSIGNLERLRYLNLSKTPITSFPDSIHRLVNLRSLDLSGNKQITTLPTSIGKLENLRYLNLSRCPRMTTLPEPVRSFKNLQTLDLSDNNQLRDIPSSIGDLQSLRYFNLYRCSGIRFLPESICRLSNLQSLNLTGCWSLVELPEATRNMGSLRHLDIHSCLTLTKMPVGIGQLTCLLTLSLFLVVRPNTIGASIKELQGLNQLRGKLEIKGLEQVKDAQDASQANLKSKQYLTRLTLLWCWDKKLLHQCNHLEVLEGLQLPPNLQELEIDCYRETCFPKGFLQNLNTLQTLRITNCLNLASLPEGLKDLTSMQYLRITNCPKLGSRCKKEKGEYWHIISHIPKIVIDSD